MLFTKTAAKLIFDWYKYIKNKIFSNILPFGLIVIRKVITGDFSRLIDHNFHSKNRHYPLWAWRSFEMVCMLYWKKGSMIMYGLLVFFRLNRNSSVDCLLCQMFEYQEFFHLKMILFNCNFFSVCFFFS